MSSLEVTLAKPTDADVSLSKSSSSSSLADMEERTLPFTFSPLDSYRGGKKSRRRIRDDTKDAKSVKKAGATT